MKEAEMSEMKRSPALDRLARHLVQLGLDDAPFENILETFCTGLNAIGIEVMRAHVTLRTNHPEFGSIAHRWLRDEGTHSLEFEHIDRPQQDWLQSPLYFLLEQDISELRHQLNVPQSQLPFPFLGDLKTRGGTDYVAFKRFFGFREGSLSVDPNNAPQGCLVSLTTDAATGFSERSLEDIRTILPSLVLALKSGANGQMAEDIATTYLGRDAGKRVLSGAIVRGSVQRMDAVICTFDLSGFTKLAETKEGNAIIGMLNDYFEIAVKTVQDHGGNVLKFMGDGMLAIFDVSRLEDANQSAILATLDLRHRMDEIKDRRNSADLPCTGFTLALHRGEVLYGNIGGRNRMDFTVIGPAVNTTARLSGMCAHVDQNIVISANVARPLLSTRDDLVSLGQYRLRGVRERQELFTLD